MRLRSPKRVVDEIEDLVRSHDVRTITFVDNVFNNPPHHAEEICQEIIARKLDIHWSAWLNEEHITREFMKLAREAGCTRIGLSPDGFSDRSLKMLGKPMTKKNIVDTYNVMKKIDGIKIRYNFFYWPPGQDLITFLKLLWFNIKARWTLRGKLEVFNLGNIALYDNTQLHKEALRKGIISEDVDLFFSVFRYPVPKLLDLFEKVYKSSIFMKRLVRKRSKKWYMPDDLSQY